MKKFTLLVLAAAASSSLFAQKADSADMSAGYVNNVYYSLENSTVKTSANTDWHIAFSAQPSAFPFNTLQGTTIRVNSGRAVEVYRVPSQKIVDFAAIDTTGIGSWTPLMDSDTSWDYGSFNDGLNLNLLPPNGPDYGWGLYNSTSKNVETDSSVFIIKGAGFIKKFYINRLEFDTAFYFTIDNLDNSSLVNGTLNKKDYSDRLFAYYNVQTNTWADLEPAKTDWNIVFTRYFSSSAHYYVTGVLQNKGTLVARAAQVPDLDAADEATYASLYTTNISTIGSDWKYFDGSTYLIEDSLAYFIKSGSDKFKLYFTKFDMMTGKAYFNLFDLNATTGVKGISAAKIYAEAYPNPTAGQLQVQVPFDGLQQEINLSITDMSGRVVLTDNFVNTGNAHTINLSGSSLNKGLYFLHIQTVAGQQTLKVVLQ